MTNDNQIIDIAKLLFVLKNEEELIIKPFHPATHEIEAVERGKIVSRLNKHLLDYQISDKTNTFTISSLFIQRIILIHPETKEVIFELFHNRLPLFKVFCQQVVRRLATLSNEFQSVGSIQKRLAFTKIWYDVYNNKREHVLSLILRKSYIKNRIQHRTPEVEIFSSNKIKYIGRIYPYSTDLEYTEYGRAVAVKIPRDMKVELKATLLISALILKSRLN